MNQYATIGGNSMACDSRGNLTVDKAGYQYTCDCDNRITQITDGSDNVIVNYTCDALGRRRIGPNIKVKGRKMLTMRAY